MKSAVETLNPTRVKLTVEVPSADLKPKMDAAYKQIGAQVNVPGFRKGKVPARIIDQRFGRGAVVQEAVNDALPEYYSQAVQEHELQPLSQPEVNLTELPMAEGQDLKFEAEIDVVPSFELPDFSGIEVEVDPVTVSEEDVQERLDELRARFGTLVGVDRPAQDGDFTSIDLTATIEGEEIDTVTGVSYEIGSGNMLEGLDDALIGASAGEEVEFTSALASGDRVGQESEVTVTLHSVKERELPEVDDEFAQLASEFDTVEELQADLQAKAEQGVRFEQGVQARDRVLDAMLEMTDIPLPDNLVEAEVTSHLEKEERLEDDEHRTEVTESTRRAMKTQFLLDALVIRDEVNVDQGELIEYIMMTAQQYNMNPNEFAQRIDQDGQIPAMVTEVGRRKALAGVLEQAKVVDTDGEVVDLNALNALDEVDEEGLGEVDEEGLGEDDSDDDVLQDEDRSDTDVSDGGAQEVADPAQELDEDAATEADVETDDEGEADVDSDAGTESEELEPASAEAGQDR